MLYFPLKSGFKEIVLLAIHDILEHKEFISSKGKVARGNLSEFGLITEHSPEARS